MNRLRPRVALRALAAAATLALAGCGVPKGELEGKVTFNGTPLPGGMVIVQPSKGWTEDDNPVATATKVQPDGSYYLSNIPLGPAKLAVMTMGPFPLGINPANKPREYLGPYVPIPLHYHDVNKAGLATEIKRGRQEFNIALTGTAEAKPGATP